MGVWIFMLAVCLLIPGIMVCAGYFMAKHPPKKINFFIGYRTSLSMKNEDTWRFAQNICGRLCMRWGAILLPLSVLLMLPLYGRSEEVVGGVGVALATLQLIVLLAAALTTERVLRKHFDRDGNPIQPDVK